MAKLSSQTTTTLSLSLTDLLPLLQTQYPCLTGVCSVNGKITVPDPDIDDPDGTRTVYIPGHNEIELTIIHEAFIPK